MKTRLAVARGFYGSNTALQVQEFLRGFAPPSGDIPLPGAVVPHAGWRYSGRVAARVWATVAAAGPPSTVILLGAVHSHYEPFTAAVWPSGSWETPGGAVQIDEDLARDMLSRLGRVLKANPSAHLGEHSLEVQLPMLSALLPSARILPVAVPPDRRAHELGDALGAFLAERGDPVTVVASTDLTHYGRDYGFAPAGSGESARRWMEDNDRRMLDLLERLDAAKVVQEARAHHNACGAGAVAVAVSAAKRLGADHGRVLEYTTSHHEHPESPEFSMAVGYAGVVFLRG